MIGVVAAESAPHRDQCGPCAIASPWFVCLALDDMPALHAQRVQHRALRPTPGTARPGAVDVVLAVTVAAEAACPQRVLAPCHQASLGVGEDFSAVAGDASQLIGVHPDQSSSLATLESLRLRWAAG